MSSVIQVIEPNGILDGTKAQEFRQKINQSIESGATTIVVDFNNVTFMDSSGLGALVLSLKTVRAAGVELILCSINEQIRMLFELTSMDRVFEIFSSRQDVEEKLRQRPSKF